MCIRVYAVAPDITKADMVAALPDKMIAPLIANIPLGHIGEPEDVASPFVHLASDMSIYVMGAILLVDAAARSWALPQPGRYGARERSRAVFA